MIRRPPSSTRTGSLCPSATLFRSADGVTRCNPGDRIVASVDWGGFAEQVVAAAENVFVLSDDLPLEDAVPVPMAYGTSYGAVVWRAELKPGQSMLVHGAAGGVGLAAVERSEEHTSELQSLMRISYAVFCLKKKKTY